MRLIPLSIPNTVGPICLNSDQPESLLSETNAKNRFSRMHFTPVIWKPRCLTPTWKFRNEYVRSIEKKMLSQIMPTVT